MSIKDIGAGMVPSYHSTESKDEAQLVVLTARVNKLETENDKLRELVRHMWRDFEACLDHGEARGWTNYMRELGVEVD